MKAMKNVMKKALGQAKDVSGEVKIKITDLQEKEWAEPTATALKVTGAIIDGLSFVPGASVLIGAFKLG